MNDDIPTIQDLKPRGRPPLAPAKRKVYGLNTTIRLPKELRDKLMGLAVAHARTLSKEIQHRLEHSFDEADAMPIKQFLQEHECTKEERKALVLHLINLRGKRLLEITGVTK